jgi:hypothetical protein
MPSLIIHYNRIARYKDTELYIRKEKRAIVKHSAVGVNLSGFNAKPESIKMLISNSITMRHLHTQTLVHTAPKWILL